MDFDRTFGTHPLGFASTGLAKWRAVYVKGVIFRQPKKGNQLSIGRLNWIQICPKTGLGCDKIMLNKTSETNRIKL